MSASVPTSSAVRALAMEYKSMEEEPVEGFRVKLVNDESLFEWEVAIFGPPDTLYQGGYFKVRQTRSRGGRICGEEWNTAERSRQTFTATNPSQSYAFGLYNIVILRRLVFIVSIVGELRQHKYYVNRSSQAETERRGE